MTDRATGATRRGCAARDPVARDAPALQDVLDALDDPDCRTIVEHLAEPRTVNELSEACDVPVSTMYRKLDLLSDASLLAEETEVRADGQHTTRYALAFEEVRIALDDDRTVEVAIKRRDRGDRLAERWSEVREARSATRR